LAGLDLVIGINRLRCDHSKPEDLIFAPTRQNHFARWHHSLWMAHAKKNIEILILFVFGVFILFFGAVIMTLKSHVPFDERYVL
jgi:hypothetical protein